MTRLSTSVAAGLVIAGLGFGASAPERGGTWITPVLGQAKTQERSADEADEPVALVNDEPIPASRLDAEIQPHLFQIEEQLRRLRRTVLMKLIDNLLLEQAAQREGIDLEEFLRRRVEDVAVSDEEVEEAYRRNRERFVGALAPEAKYRIRRDLEDNRRADAMRRLLEGLRREARVTNFLLEGPPADPAAEPAPSVGRREAPITVVEFCDLQCVFCRDAQPVMRRVLATWGDDVRLVFRHFPLPAHPHAFEAATAAVCAERRDRFWEFLDELFVRGPDFDGSELSALAETAGLNEADFRECPADPQTAARVRRDVELGRRAGVDGTPAIFVNGRRIRDVEWLDAAIREALEELGEVTSAGDR